MRAHDVLAAEVSSTKVFVFFVRYLLSDCTDCHSTFFDRGGGVVTTS